MQPVQPLALRAEHFQSLVGLYDLAHATGDPRAQRLFAAGDRAARREIPRYDTGAWSLYSLGGRESDLGYHRLVREGLHQASDVCGKLAGYFAQDHQRAERALLVDQRHYQNRIETAGQRRVERGTDRVVTVDIRNGILPSLGLNMPYYPLHGTSSDVRPSELRAGMK